MARCEELQQHTLRILAQLGQPGKPLSARAAGEKLDIGYNQIADMAKGKTPAEKTLIKFACAVGENPADWLRFAGKHEFAKTLDIPDVAVETETQRAGKLVARELARVAPKYRSLVLRQALAVIKAAQDADDAVNRQEGTES